MKDFVALSGLGRFVKENGKTAALDDLCSVRCPKFTEEITNEVKPLYDLFSADDISKKIAELVTLEEGIEPEVGVIYQSIEGLHKACPNHLGDWYFTGNFPTPGGNRVVNKAFMILWKGKMKGRIKCPQRLFVFFNDIFIEYVFKN
ncbi:MAG: hypothetical protein R2825_03760 [Saprospiraceae bacterium]